MSALLDSQSGTEQSVEWWQCWPVHTPHHYHTGYYHPSSLGQDTSVWFGVPLTHSTAHHLGQVCVGAGSAVSGHDYMFCRMILYNDDDQLYALSTLHCDCTPPPPVLLPCHGVMCQGVKPLLTHSTANLLQKINNRGQVSFLVQHL